MRILVIEDNERIGALTIEGLKTHGFACDLARDLGGADEVLAVATFHTLVLDLGMPDGDGCAWLTERRQSGFSAPVIMLTARSALDDRVRGLDAGADDYLSKPFAISELAARIRALLRRPGERANAVLTMGPIVFDTVSRAGSCNGVPLHLTAREAALLELMLVRAGDVVTREQIESALYSFREPVTPNAIEALVSRLRKKLSVCGVGGQLLTLRGVGYVMVERGR